MIRVSLSPSTTLSSFFYWMRRADEGPLCESEAGADVPPLTTWRKGLGCYYPRHNNNQHYRNNGFVKLLPHFIPLRTRTYK
jgi:hypothetical protein